MATSSNQEITLHYEVRRACAAGILETAGVTFLLLIAVRWFEAGPTAKSIIASAGSFGLLIAPFGVRAARSLNLSPSRAASWLLFLSSVAFALMTVFPLYPLFIGGSLLALVPINAGVPFYTQIYQENYPELQRGRLFSKSVRVRIAMAALFSEAAGWLLSFKVSAFPLLLAIFAGCAAYSSHCLSKCPTTPLPKRTQNWMAGTRQALGDKIFRYTLICWMLMGFGNLMMLPLRVEYLANPKYGLGLTVGQVAFLTGVIPNLARFCLSPVWGMLFDRVNFFVLRIILNLGFIVGIISFFLSNSPIGLFIGALIFGISQSGGDIAWNLWVTKFAPAGKTTDYMAIHTSLTGLRGVLAPIVAFQAVEIVSIEPLAVIALILIVAACLFLIPEALEERKRITSRKYQSAA